LSPDDVVTLI